MPWRCGSTPFAAASRTGAWRGDTAVCDHVGTSIHHWYGGAESILERTVRAFEGLPARGDRWHSELLDQAALHLPGVRAPIVCTATRDALRKVLAFRDFFRHAYAMEWDVERLRVAAADTLVAHEGFTIDIDALLGRI